MFILWRYIIREHIGPFVFGLSIITLFLLLNLVFRELGKIVSRGLSLAVIGEFIVLNMAWMLALSVPMAVLIATLMAFGRLSGDGEITAMKAGGISILTILKPVIVSSILLALFLVWFNNKVLPDANYRTKLLASDIGRKRPTISLEAGVMYTDIEDYGILVGDLEEQPDTSYVKNVYIEDNSDPNSSTYILAEHGKIYLDTWSGMLFLILFNGEMHELDLEKMEQYNRITFPRQKLSIPVPDMILSRTEEGYRGDREKSAQMMLAEVETNKKDIATKKHRAGELIQDYFNKYLSQLSETPADLEPPFQSRSFYTSGLRFQQDKIRADHIRLKKQINAELASMQALTTANSRLLVEVHKKYSIPFACIVFVLIGAPLGIMSRRGNMTVAGGISFLFFLLYWASLIGGEELADNRFITPFISMWSANILCLAAGIYLILHSIHEATFIHWEFVGKLLKIRNT